MQDSDNWINSHRPTFSAFDSSYSLPDNVAIITLQVPIFPWMAFLVCSMNLSFHKLSNVIVSLVKLKN